MSVTQNYNHIKVAVIGCGNWGKNLIRVLHGLGSLAAICDLDSARSAQLSQQYDVPSLSFDEILNNKAIAGVFIATPSRTHFDVGLASLKASKHVYIEKPFASTFQQASKLHELANQQQRTLMIGHLLQYHRAFTHMKSLLHDGALGDLQYIYANRFNFGKFPNEESVLMDYAPHDISMILSLVRSMPLTVMASNANHLQHTVSDTSSIQLTFPGNVKAHIFSSWLYPFKEQKMIIVGSKAMAIFEDSQPWESKLRLCPYPAQWVDGLPQPFAPVLENVPVSPAEPLQNECSHFLACIASGEKPLTSSLEGLKVMAVLEAAMQSMRSEAPINLGDKEYAFAQNKSQAHVQLESVS